MWCWHRIRESETGLCPACRTPYGEDPHQFTALDVEEVLKANKAAQAAAKRERQASISQNSQHGHSNNDANTSSDHDPLNGTTMEVPKDRTQLANMRVIRRNLVYAVGLPIHIATEEILRKPEYFGQYGKIAKIVLNRSQPTEGNDPRRATASAYVTFQHKEDTLTCILALDGFYLENRNIRASYGTSKYCSAFIKNVRCNNPDCTYLHEMGATEDTFTKQEIQAGYVTSGRDVLARQQQIVAEQLLQQQQSASGGSIHAAPRKRVGGGGPSGTGKASAHPVLPPPEYDEPAKQAPMVPPPAGISRATTTQATMSASQQAAMLNPATISAKLGRSSSVGVAAVAATAPPTGRVGGQPHRKSHSGGTTAAAVVAAGGRKDSLDASQPHSTLSALTPLKRSSVGGKAGVAPKAQPVEEKLPNVRNGKKQNSAKAAAAAVAAVSANTSSGSLGGHATETATKGDAGALIGSSSGSGDEGVGSLGGLPIPVPAGPLAAPTNRGGGTASLLGGDLYTGSLPGQSNNNSAAFMGGSSLLGGAPLVGGPVAGGAELGLRGNSGLWSGGGGAAPGPPGNNGVIGSHISNNSGNSSSALASILGINLPTGSGSLQESSSLWSAAPQPPAGPSPLSTLNKSSIQQNPLPIGASSHSGPPQTTSTGGSSLIGGVPLSGGSSNMAGHGAIAGGGTKTSDIALLQSLLPGVHITSDTVSGGFGGSGGMANWAAPGSQSQQQGHGGSNVGGNPLNPSQNWGGGVGNHIQGHVGAIGQNTGQQNQRQQNPGIW